MIMRFAMKQLRLNRGFKGMTRKDRRQTGCRHPSCYEENVLHNLWRFGEFSHRPARKPPGPAGTKKKKKNTWTLKFNNANLFTASPVDTKVDTQYSLTRYGVLVTTLQANLNHSNFYILQITHNLLKQHTSAAGFRCIFLWKIFKSR